MKRKKKFEGFCKKSNETDPSGVTYSGEAGRLSSSAFGGGDHGVWDPRKRGPAVKKKTLAQLHNRAQCTS